MTSVELNLDIDEHELYYYLLEDIYSNLDKHSNIFNDTNEVKITKPDVHFDVTRKTMWRNFRKIANQMNRSEEHIANFYKKEYNTTNSVNKDGELMIRGRYSNQMVATTLKNYIRLFLQCSACKTINTCIEKKNRLNYLLCNNKICNYEQVINYDMD